MAVIVVGAFVGALFLKVLPPIILLAALVVGVFFLRRVLKTRMRKDAEIGEVATLGLRLEPVDPFGLLGYPLSLFGRGTDGEIGEVEWGTWRGVDVKAFHYTYAPAVPPMIGRRPGAVRAQLSCAIAAIEGVGPPVVAEPTSFVLSLGGHAPMEEIDVPDGSAAFVVRCDDPVFAGSLVAGRAGDWLAEGGEEWGFEMNGSLLMIYGAPGNPSSVAEVLGRLVDLRVRIAETVSGVADPDPRPAGTA